MGDRYLVVPGATMQAFGTGRVGRRTTSRGTSVVPCLLVLRLDDEFIAAYFGTETEQGAA